MQRVNIGLVCLSWLVLASAVSAQTAVDPSSSAGVASLGNFSGGGLLSGTYFDVRTVTGDGVGYRDSYSQIGGFTPFWINEDSFIATNSRLIITNSTQIGVNTGLVGRRYVDGLDRIFGVYGYYDNDQNYLNNRYTQFTIGGETLGQWWDMRANGYILNGSQGNFIQALSVGGNPYFTGHQLAFLGTQLRDQAMGGGDFEFGVPVHGSAKWLRAYSGVYAYRTGQQDTFGYRGRVEAMVSNDLTLGVIVSEDRLWGPNINATVDFKFSGFQPTRYFPNMTTRERMLNPVQRNWRIATHTYQQNVDIAAINPLTNQPYFITHVNNAAGGGGDGTYQHPFTKLPDSAPGDIILVHRGNSTEANPVTGSITLSDNQRLLGDGKLSTVDLYARYGNSSVSGTYNLPGTSNSGLYPFVSSDGNIVTLANNNEVAALNLLNAGGSAITNTAAGSHNFLLQCLEIAGNKGAGINLTNASGVGIIRGINMGATNHPNPFGFGQNAGGGIQISTDGPGLNLSMTNVAMNANAAKTQPFGVKLIADRAYLNLDMNNVITNGNGSGIEIIEHSQVVNANMNLVRANNNTSTGIRLVGSPTPNNNGGLININMNNVAAMGNGSDNLQIGTQALPITTSAVTINANDTNFSNSKGGSGVVFSLYGGVGTLNLFNSVVTNNAVDGLGIYGSNGTLLTSNVQTSNFQGNGRDAFHAEGTSNANVNLFVNSTNAAKNGRDGLFYQMNNFATFNVAFLNDNLNQSGMSAVSGNLANQAAVNLYFNNTTGRDSDGDGFYLNAAGGSIANLQIDNGTLANSGRVFGGSSAFNIVSDNSTVNLQSNFVAGNNIDSSGNAGTQAYGLTLNLTNGSLFTGNIYNSDLSDTLLDAISANVASGSNASLTLINTSGNRSGWDGFVANVDYATLTTNFRNSNFSSSGRDGMNFHVTNGGILNSTFQNSSFDLNGRDGIDGRVVGTNSVAVINLLDGSSVDSNGTNGIEFLVDAGQLGINGTSTSISNNGLAGANGSGVLGVVNNGGLTQLNFNNETINSNLDNGVSVATHTGASVQATFNLGTVNFNGTQLITPRGNNGILLDLDDSPISFLQIYNGAAISGNGNDGVSVLATNGTNFSASLGTDLFGSQFSRGISILNNGAAPTPPVQTRAGVDITSATGSTVNLLMDGATIGNVGSASPQQIGLLFEASTGGTLNANVITSNLTRNGANAINGTVSGSGSVANVSLINVNGNQSGNIGALLDVTNGGELNVATGVNTSFSQNGGAGMLVQVDGASSIANLELDLINLNDNGQAFGGQGFNGLASNGGTLNACIDTSSIATNANQGIQLTAVNANSLINFNLAGSTVDNNSSQGLLIRVNDLATINYRSSGNTYNGNGINGVLDGVSVTAIGNGPLDSATARLLFSSDQINNSTGNGFSLTALNGATLTTTIENGVSASNNGGYGIFTNVSGANTEFNLLMNGANTFAGNTLGPISPLVFANMNQVVLDISGTFNNSLADGVKVDLQNINNAIVALNGPGTIDNSALNGINVNMQNITNGSLLIDGFSSISNSGQDGIHVNFDTVANGAIQIEGPTAINNSGGNGVSITLNNTNLVNGLAFSGATVEVLTLADSLSSPLDGCLPAVVTVSLNALGNVPTNALVIDSVTAIGSGKDGIVINGTNSNIATNGSFITNNLISTSKTDGLHLNFQTVKADGMVIAYNGAQNNGGNGVNVELFNSPLDNLNIYGNTGGASGIAGTLNFLYDANGPLNLMANTSTAGINIANVTLNLAPTGQYYRPDQTLTPIGTYAFLPAPPTDVSVGLDSVDGVAITPGNYPVQDTSGNVLPFGGVPVDSQVLSFGFNNFTPAAFAWQYFLAHGENSSSGNVINTSIAGATGTVTLTDGRQATGVLTAIGGGGAEIDQLQINQALAAISPGISSNGLDGLRFNLNNSSLTNLNVSFNELSGNGVSGVGHGIEFTGATGTVSNSDITNATFNHNTINSNSGDGFRLVNPTTVGNTISAVFSNNTINSNTGTGVNLSLVNGQQNLQADFLVNTINQNAGGPGVNIHLGNNANMTGLFEANTINQNGAQGVNFTMGTNGQLTTDFTNNTISGNQTEGINITLGTGGQFNSANFFGNNIGAVGAGNGGMGVRLTAPDQSSFNWNLGDSTKGTNVIASNADAGVGITMTGSATGTLNIANSDFTNTRNGADQNFNGEGLHVIQQGSSVLTGGIVDSTFTSNAADGAFFEVTGNNAGFFAQLNNFTVGSTNPLLGNLFTNNGRNGLEFFRTADGEISNITIDNNTLDANTQNGLVIRAANKFQTDSYTINNNDISRNGLNGILFDERADANISANMNQNTINNNGLNGVQLVEQINAGVDQRALTGVWTQNTFNSNRGDGILLAGQTNNLLIGDPADLNLGNSIALNTLNGIEVTGSGTLTIGSNVITQNGTLANLNTAAENAAILMNVRPSPTSAIEIENNVITNNFGDGIQYQISKTQANATASVSIHDNEITNNSGRGINMINRQSNTTQADIFNNSISGNRLEGIYVVNTSSGTQDVWVSSSTPLVADGNIFQTPTLEMRFVNNEVLGNGVNSTLAGTGLVVRVGTSDGGFGPTFAGGFASSGTALVEGGSPFGLSTGFGGVTAVVDDNLLGGNFGNDVLFHSYVSTVNPITAAGTWDNTQYSPTAYQSDPLSRFDLYFRNNITDASSVDPLGRGLGGYATRNPALVAFYNDADGVFKSRLNNIAAPNIAGPFNSATRARNATRLAARIPNFSAPNVPPGLQQLYPGIGASTWRVSADSIDGVNFITGFNVDNNPYNTTNDANGFNLNGIGNNGELPFGYGSF